MVNPRLDDSGGSRHNAEVRGPLPPASSSVPKGSLGRACRTASQGHPRLSVNSLLSRKLSLGVSQELDAFSRRALLAGDEQSLL